MRAIWGALAGLLLGAVPAAAQPPQRVVTVNLCLDQLALRLAAPGQLAAVSYLARDPGISVLAEQARAVPAVRDRAESILEMRPDLAIFDASTQGEIKRLVRQAGVPVLEMPWASSLEEAGQLIQRMAGALGREAEGRALVQDLQERRRRLAWNGPPAGTAAVLQPNWATSGTGSLMDQLLRLAGFRNLAAEFGLPAYATLSPERVVAAQPDLLVLDADADAYPSRASEFASHHALAALAKRTRLLSVPMKYSICAGPENVEVLRLLAAARP